MQIYVEMLDFKSVHSETFRSASVGLYLNLDTHSVQFSKFTYI